jgi:hypothetical protein
MPLGTQRDWPGTSVPGLSDTSEASPVGTAESFPDVPLVAFWIRSLPSVCSLSIVPTGLVLNLMHNPGTEVPGYFHLVPTGREMAKLHLFFEPE